MSVNFVGTYQPPQRYYNHQGRPWLHFISSKAFDKLISQGHLQTSVVAIPAIKDGSMLLCVDAHNKDRKQLVMIVQTLNRFLIKEGFCAGKYSKRVVIKKIDK